SLKVHLSTAGGEVDVLSSPGTVNLWGNSNTTVNVCPTSEDLDGLGWLGVYNANPGTINWLDPQGSIKKVKGPTLNGHDEADSNATVGYSISDSHLSRSAASQPKVDIDYDISTTLSLDTGWTPASVSVDSTPGPTSITCGAADTVTVRDGVNVLGLLTVDAHGGTLTLKSAGIENDPDPENTLTHSVKYAVTDHSVNWSDNWKLTVVSLPDPEQLHSPHKKV